MTTREASEYTRRVDPAGRGLSISYLTRAAQMGRIQGAHKIETGPFAYWEFDQAGLDEYLSNRRTQGRRA